VGGAVQVVLTFVKIASVLLVIGVAFFLSGNTAHPADPLWPSAAGAGVLGAFLAALAAALWAYDGWEDLNLVGSEVKNPERNFPLALVGGCGQPALGLPDWLQPRVPWISLRHRCDRRLGGRLGDCADVRVD